METKGLTCKIPLDLHNRITEEIRQSESTMSKFIEQIILEHYTKGATTMDTTLPIIARTSGQQFVVVSIFHGFIVDFSVPFLVTLFCSL